MCQNQARIGPMLIASGQLWHAYVTLWHIYKDVSCYNQSKIMRLSKVRRQYFLPISKSLFMKELFCILIKISLEIDAKGLIDYELALVQVMAWC